MTTQTTTTPLEQLPLPERRQGGRRMPQFANHSTSDVFLGSWIDEEGVSWDLYFQLDEEGFDDQDCQLAAFRDSVECDTTYVYEIDRGSELHPALTEARRRLASRMVVS